MRLFQRKNKWKYSSEIYSSRGIGRLNCEDGASGGLIASLNRLTMRVRQCAHSCHIDATPVH